MSMACYGTPDDDREFHANVSAWALLLDEGQEHGWEPAGTTHPEHPDWRGGYGSNDGQVVAAADAAAWADALERALEAGARPAATYPDFVRRFVAFCRGGAFGIY